ncbi:MAG: hypothetical protein JRJ01_02165 [Deltaproteobacteria bacterium]|nr:hypothetical protein [Deltaproteobacteria bacterium]
MQTEAPRFVADVMLGKLAKWLRVLGYDTRYGRLEEKLSLECIGEGRTLLSRRLVILERFPGAFLIRSNHVGEQLREMKASGLLALAPSSRFTRCLACNAPLERADPEAASASVPEYVFHTYTDDLRLFLARNP